MAIDHHRPLGLTVLLSEYHVLTQEAGEGQPYESNHLFGLLCNPTGIYGFQSFREVSEYKKFWAAGSGMELALGAMYATYDLQGTAAEIATCAIQAACTLDNSCGLPVQLHEVALAEEE